MSVAPQVLRQADRLALEEDTETEPADAFWGGDRRQVPLSRFATRTIDDLFSDLERDADGRAVTPCYTYADSRCGQLVAARRREIDEAEVQQRTGCRDVRIGQRRQPFITQAQVTNKQWQ